MKINLKVNKIDWQVALAYVGTVIGAGFASGQELMQFFVRFGVNGVWGAVITGILFSVLGGLTIFMTKQYGFRTYKDLLDMKLGPKIASFIDGLIMIFLFLGLSVMLSGSGALFNEHLGLPSILGILTTEGLVLLALIARDEGVLWFNTVLMPVLGVILILVIGASIVGTPVASQEKVFDPFAGSLITNNWILSSLLYISYNMISGVVVLVALAADKKECSSLGGLMGGAILLILSTGTVIALLMAGSDIFTYQIPMLYLAYQVHPFIFYLYGTVLWGAMITTAVAEAYGLCRRLQFAWKLPYFLVMIIVIVTVIPFSLFDFAKLVSRVYPLFGYLSLIITLIIIKQGLFLIKDYLRHLLKR